MCNIHTSISKNCTYIKVHFRSFKVKILILLIKFHPNFVKILRENRGKVTELRQRFNEWVNTLTPWIIYNECSTRGHAHRFSKRTNVISEKRRSEFEFSAIDAFIFIRIFIWIFYFGTIDDTWNLFLYEKFYRFFKCDISLMFIEWKYKYDWFGSKTW